MMLKDQVAIVTGGSRGIGRGIVLALAAQGAKVAFVYRGNAAAAESLEKEVAAAGGVAKAYQGDVADPEAAPRIAKAVKAEWQKIDILVNNAGIIKDTLFPRMDFEAWKTVIDTNVHGVYAFCKAVLEEGRPSRIVNISSIAATYVNAGQSNYASSKGAINSFTMCLAKEYGRRMTVNAIAPGFIETDMTQAVLGALDSKAFANKIPAKRLGKPDDIANVVVFLCSPAAAYVTGQVIAVDGGLSLGMLV